VAGWHFREAFYKSLKAVSGVDIYVVSHRDSRSLPAWTGDVSKSDRVLVAANEGYDWGCYQQFLETGIHRKYRYVFFMHDDIEIVDPRFPDAVVRLLNSGTLVVGNGRNEELTDWPERWPWSYAHSTWVPPSLAFRHRCVRGSFVATTSTVLERLGCFEVFWDRWHAGEDVGNWSQVATCGKLEYLFGEKTFGYLSAQPLVSSYLVEHVRGRRSGGPQISTVPATTPSAGLRRSPLAVRLFVGVYRRVGGAYARMRIRNSPLAFLLEHLVAPPSRRAGGKIAVPRQLA